MNSLKRLGIFLYLIPLLFSIGCSQFQDKDYIKANFKRQAIEGDIIYEYSYITPKDKVINTKELNQEQALIYVSLGKPQNEEQMGEPSCLVKIEDEIYYAKNDNQIHVIKDGSIECLQEYPFSPFIIGTDGENLYCTTEENNLIKLDQIGGYKEIAANISPYFLLIANKHIYYTDLTEGEGICRITLNGNEKTSIGVNMYIFGYDNGFLYYNQLADDNESYELWRVNTDTLVKEKISGLEYMDIELKRGEMYGIDYQNDLYKLGSNETKPILNIYRNINSEYLCSFIGSDEKNIYVFNNGIYKSQIIRIDKNTYEKHKMYEGELMADDYQPVIIDGWIYFYEWIYNEHRLNFVKLNVENDGMQVLGGGYMYPNRGEF